MKERALLLATLAATAIVGPASEVKGAGIEDIATIVVIYAENRSFDNLYGSFPGANGLSQVTPAGYTQLDRDGSVLKELPPVWDGLTAKGVVPPVTQAQTEHLPNAPFAIDDPKGFNTPLSVTTHDLWHRFYQNQMQINGGKNDRFVAYADSGALVMGHYDDNGSKLPLWDVARQYVLADNFFMGGFGGSFFNHFALICACAPTYPNADQSPAKDSISAVEARRRGADYRGQFAQIGDRRHPEIRQGRQPDTRFLCGEHDAAALPAERQQARAGGQPCAWRTRRSRPRCRRRRNRRSAIC